MHNHALSNWDGSQSKKKNLSTEAEKVKDKQSNILSAQHEGLASPNFASISKGRLSMDSTTAETSATIFVNTSSENLNSRKTSMANEFSKSDPISVQKVDQTSGLKPIAPLPSRTLSTGYAQVQVKSSCSQKGTTEAISRPARIATSMQTPWIIARKVQIFHQSANHILKRVDHSQDIPSRLSHPNDEKPHLTFSDINKPDRKPTSATKLTWNPSPTHTHHRHTKFQDSRLPFVPIATTKAEQNQALHAQNPRRSTLSRTKTIKRPIAPTDHQLSPHLFASDSSTQLVKNESNLTALASVMPSYPDPSASIPAFYKEVQSILSINADSSSVDVSNFELLKPAQSSSRSQPHSISPPTFSRSSQISSTQRLDELELAPHFFASTPQISPSQTPHIRQELSQALQFICVEIPPLSPGKNMTSYHSLKELKYVQGVTHTRYLKPRLLDANPEIADPEQDKHRREQEKKGERKWMKQKKISETNLDPIVPATTLSGTQSQQEEKLVLYDPLTHQFNGNSSKNIPPTVTNASEKEGQQDSLPVLASCGPALSLFISSSDPDERGKSASEPDPFSAPDNEVSYMDSDTPAVQDIELQNLEHVPAAIVYFNTRFSQNTLPENRWIILGTRARLNCVKSRGSLLEEQMETEGNLSAGAPLWWRGCTFADEQSSSSCRKEQEGMTVTEKLSGKVDFGRAASSTTLMSVPKLNLAEIYKSQNSASSRKGQRRRGRSVNLQSTGPLNTLVADSTSSEETQGQPTIVVIQQDTSYHLSEKARGKQKAVDPDFLDDTMPYLPTAPTDTLPSSYPSFDPHDAFDKDMEDYVAFNLSLDKSSDHGSENNTIGSMFSLVTVSTSPSPTIVPQYHKNPFRSQSNLKDIFLAPQAPGSPVSSSLDSTGNGNYWQPNDPCRITCLEGENNLDELTTINPAFLGGGLEVYDGDLQDSSSSSSPQPASTWPSQTQNYAVQLSRMPVNANSLVSDKDQDKGDRQFPRGLVNCLEESAGSFLSKDAPFTKLPYQTLATEMKEPLKTTLQYSESMSSRTRQKAPRRQKQQWPMGKEDAYCHQCRRKTRYLKMSCPCSKRYCSRCMALRYPERTFCLQLDDLDCPSCRNECNCDLCTRKRGENYISFKVSAAQAARKSLPIRIDLGSSDGVGAAPAPVVDSAVLFDDIRDTRGTFTLGGGIPDSVVMELTSSSVILVDNRRRAVSTDSEYIDADEIPMSRRTFAGACQPSWRLGKSPIIRELGGRRINRARGEQRHEAAGVTRWFVGKERPLHLPVIAFARNLRTPKTFDDLSSLSSLSGNSDVEAGLKSNDLPANDTTSRLFKSSITNFDPTAITTKDTIRALTTALEACGMIAKIEV